MRLKTVFVENYKYEVCGSAEYNGADCTLDCVENLWMQAEKI